MKRAVLVLAVAVMAEARAEDHPLSEPQRAALEASLDARIAALTEQIADAPKNIELYSSRGSAYFFRGRFAESLADFDKMIELEPGQAVEHWRRGISLYYLERWEESAKQFERYHAFDSVDRENGIWRFLGQARVIGVDRARKELLRYERDDRAPFPDLYEMYAGRLAPDEVLRRIEEANVDRAEKEKRRFFGQMYVGFLAWTNRDAAAAEKHLHLAVANSWGQEHAGYMWQVARVHYDFMRREDAKRPPEKP